MQLIKETNKQGQKQEEEEEEEEEEAWEEFNVVSFFPALCSYKLRFALSCKQSVMLFECINLHF